MKPNNQEQEEPLDDLAAGLDAGWDTPAPVEAQASPSQAPLSTPPGEALDALDADWDLADSASASLPSGTPSRAKRRGRKPRPSAAQPVQLRPGAAPLRVTKQERREAERKRLAHQAQQKSANKQQRKAERQEEARRASEQRRAQQLAQVERQASLSPPRAKAVKRAEEPSAPSPKRVAKQARREQSPRPAPSSAPAKSSPVKSVFPVMAAESGVKKLLPLVAIAIVVGGTLCFALLRAAGH
jgi:hypothetical protein